MLSVLNTYMYILSQHVHTEFNWLPDVTSFCVYHQSLRCPFCGTYTCAVCVLGVLPVSKYKHLATRCLYVEKVHFLTFCSLTPEKTGFGVVWVKKPIT